jgi:hypothetical protein
MITNNIQLQDMQCTYKRNMEARFETFIVVEEK